MYILERFKVLDETYAMTALKCETRLWHVHLDHMSEKCMNILHKENLLPRLRSCKLEFCDYGVSKKHMRRAFGIGIHRSKTILEYVHYDV